MQVIMMWVLCACDDQPEVGATCNRVRAYGTAGPCTSHGPRGAEADRAAADTGRGATSGGVPGRRDHVDAAVHGTEIAGTSHDGLYVRPATVDGQHLGWEVGFSLGFRSQFLGLILK